MEVIWLFQLIGCLVVLFIWIRVVESGNEEVQRRHEQTWSLGIGGYHLLGSKKGCKFLQGYVKFPLCDCIDCLHFVPDIRTMF